MVYASCRWRHFGGSIAFADRVTWSGDAVETLRDRRVLVIVHGTANSTAELHGLGAEIANRTSGSYDAWVVFCWPGGVTGFAYLATKFIAVRRAARFLAEVLDTLRLNGALTIDVDAHSLGVPIALEAARQVRAARVAGWWLKAGACSRSLAKYRKALEGSTVRVFYSPKDLIVSVLYRVWFGFRGALGAHGERTPGGNIGHNHDVSDEIGGSHINYRRSSTVVQEMRNERARRETERSTDAISNGELPSAVEFG